MPKRISRGKTIPDRPLLQRIMAAIGAAATVATVAVLAHEALRPAAPPALSARIGEVQPTAAGYVATVVVDNAGRETAAAVDLEGALGDQTATATLAYVPGRGRATAYLRFDADPRAAAVSVKGWSEP